MDAKKIAIDIADTVAVNRYIRSLGPEFIAELKQIVAWAAVEVLSNPDVQIALIREPMQQQERTDGA
jgi:hypothetical protein